MRQLIVNAHMQQGSEKWSHKEIRSQRIKLSWATDPFEDLIKRYGSYGTLPQKSIAMQTSTTLKSIQSICFWVSLNLWSRSPSVEKAKSWGRIVYYTWALHVALSFSCQLRVKGKHIGLQSSQHLKKGSRWVHKMISKT